MTQEVWRKCERFPRYEVSNLGRFRSWAKSGPQIAGRSQPRLLKSRRDPRNGYIYVHPTCTTRRRQFATSLHGLVCEAFHGARPLGMIVRHLDGNKEHNTADNLAWGTPKQNSGDRYEHGTMLLGSVAPAAKLRDVDVAAILIMRGTYAEIADKFGVSSGTIREIKTGRRWMHIKIRDTSL